MPQSESELGIFNRIQAKDEATLKTNINNPEGKTQVTQPTNKEADKSKTTAAKTPGKEQDKSGKGTPENKKNAVKTVDNTKNKATGAQDKSKEKTEAAKTRDKSVARRNFGDIFQRGQEQGSKQISDKKTPDNSKSYKDELNQVDKKQQVAKKAIRIQ